MRFYQMQRNNDENLGARATVRLLESLVRLSEAHAKLMGKEQVDLDDAVVSIYLLSLSQASYKGVDLPLLILSE
jgi:DNA helicase MCM9